MRQRTLAALAFVFVLASTLAGESALTIQDYCEASLRIAQLTELQWQDRVSAARGHQGPSAALDQKLQLVDSRYEDLRSRMYSHYGTTSQDYLRFGASHQAAIRQYLAVTPEIDNPLRDVNDRVASRRAEMETIMSARHIEVTK